jgi:hypothetical protein
LKTKPKTTPECEHLLDTVLQGLRSNPFEYEKKLKAEAALEILRKKRGTKALEYIMEESTKYLPIDSFAQEICKRARESL